MRRKIAVILSFCVTLTVCAQTSHAIWMMRGQYCMRMGNYEKAIECFESALEADDIPKGSEAKAKISECKKELEKQRQAKEAEAAKKRRKTVDVPGGQAISVCDTTEIKPILVQTASESVFYTEARYIAPGFYYENGETSGYENILKDESMTPLSFGLKIYSDKIVIKYMSYLNGENASRKNYPVEIPFVKKEGPYYVYAKDNLTFAFDPQKKSSDIGEYYSLFMVKKGRFYILLSEIENELLFTHLSKAYDETIMDNPVEDQNIQSCSNIMEPCELIDAYFLNMNSSSEIIGTSKEENLKSSEVCWLVPCVNYIYKDDSPRSYKLDVKVYSDDGTLQILDSECEQRGYSTSADLNPGKKGKGIFYPFGWGADSPGFFSAGTIKVEIWYNEELVFSCSCFLE